ncbi:MAG: ATP-binding protein [Verrucomicrobiota bacterium]
MFQKASRKRIKLKVAISGPAGSGKTTSSIRLARGLVGETGKVAVIDTENGSASLYSDRYDFDVCEVAPPFEHQKFIEAIEAAVQAGYAAVIIDSASHFWEGILEYKDKLDRRGGNSFTNWNQAGRHFKDILNAVLQSPVHVICCLRSKIDYVIEQDGKGKAAPKKVGLAPIMRDGVEYEFTTVFDIDLNHQAATSKDRTGLFTDRIFQVTEETGAQLSQWLATAPAEAAAPTQPATPTEPNVIYDNEQAPAPHLAELTQVIREGGWDQEQLTRWKLGNLDALTPEQATKAVAFLKGKLQPASEEAAQ